MANVTNLSKGSKGEDVKKLQTALIEAGYDVGSTGVDGSFGSKTLAAVKQYQKDNGLTVDGIAGKNTLGKLYSTGSNNTNTGGKTNAGSNKVVTDNGKAKEPAAGTPKVEVPSVATKDPVTSPGGVTYGDFQYESFAGYDDPVVKQALDLLNQNSANKPGAWTDPYLDKYSGYLSQYENRDPFSYDFNSDALYQQYKDNYILQGQMAMMDTMGQAAAMTGGYGNSYAQSVGQQAYNQQLNQLNDIMPELYGMAYDRYNQEGQDLLNMYSLYKGLSDQSYSQYQDTLDRWYQEDSRLTNNLNTAYNQAFNNWEIGYNTAWDEYLTGRNEKFTDEQNAKDREFTASENEKSRAESKQANAKSDLINLITATGYRPTASELKAAGMSEQEAEAYSRAYIDSQSKSTSTKTTYEALDYESQQKWGKEFERAESLSDVEDICDMMEIAGYDPQDIAWFFNKYSTKFPSTKLQIPTVTGGLRTGPNGSIGAVGGSGGVSYWEQK